MKTVNIKMYTATEEDGERVIVGFVAGYGYAPAVLYSEDDEWFYVENFLPYKQWAYEDEEYFNSLTNVKLLWSEDVPVEE